MNKTKQIYFNLNNFLLAISDSLDFVEIDLLGVTLNHAKRVAFIAINIADKLKLSKEDIFDLCAYSILHDNALVNERENACYDACKHVETIKHYGLHCELGEKNIEDFPFIGKHKNIIKYHHEYYNGNGIFGIKGDDIPLLAQLISFADTIDGLFNFSKQSIKNRETIKNFVIKNRGKLFSKKISDAFLEIIQNIGFWLDLQSEKSMSKYLLDVTYNFTIPLTFEELLNITSIFTKIIDTKSPFTKEHSSGLSQKCAKMADFYHFSHKDKMTFLIAANLHDLGKLAISNDIIDKKGVLSNEEFEIMKSHVYYTNKALNNIIGFENIAKWASNHHEKLNGSGYPYGISADKLCFKSRLMACLDIYQALKEDRPYRQGLSHKEAVNILKNMVKAGELDKKIVKDIKKVFNNTIK